MFQDDFFPPVVLIICGSHFPSETLSFPHVQRQPRSVSERCVMEKCMCEATPPQTSVVEEGGERRWLEDLLADSVNPLAEWTITCRKPYRPGVSSSGKQGQTQSVRFLTVGEATHVEKSFRGGAAGAVYKTIYVYYDSQDLPLWCVTSLSVTLEVPSLVLQRCGPKSFPHTTPPILSSSMGQLWLQWRETSQDKLSTKPHRHPQLLVCSLLHKKLEPDGFF